jgi:hypothetical protein
MALSDFTSEETIARSRRGSTSRSLGGKTVVADVTPKAPSSLPGPLQKISDVSHQFGDIVKTAGVATAKFAVNTPKYFYQDVEPFERGVARVVTGDLSRDLHNNKVGTDQLDRMQAQLVSDYKSGKISKENYGLRMQDIAQSYQDLSKEVQTVASKADRGNIVQSAAMTAADILTAGKLELGEVGARTAVQAGGKEAIKALVDQADKNLLESLATKVPVVRDLLTRNLEAGAKREVQRLAGESAAQFMLRESKSLAAHYLIKRPIFYQANIAQAASLYDNFIKGNYKGAATDAAWLGSQMIQGGPVGVFFKGKDWLQGTLRKLSYGKQSFVDELSKRIGDGNPSQIARFLTTLKTRAPGEFAEAEKTFRILQETNLRSSGERVDQAVDNVLTHYVQHGYDLSDITPSQLYKDMSNWAQADELAQRTIKSGLVPGVSPEDAAKYVVVRWDQTARQGLINAYKTDGLQGVAELMQRPGVGWSNNDILVHEIENVANSARTAQEFEDGIRAINTAGAQIEGMPKKVSEQLSKLGFAVAAPLHGRTTPSLAIEDTRKLVSGAIRGNTDIFDPANSPQPEFAAIAGWLERAGLSPTESNRAATKKLSESLVANLDNVGMGGRMGLTNSQGGDVTKGGQAILSKLQRYIEDKRPALGLGRSAAISDIRQMTMGEISEALSITKSEAKTVSHAIMDAYTQVPLEFRGLGDKIVDTLYKYNPLQKYYSRIQSAFRYTYNPFFRTQESVETKLLSHAQANNLVWGKSRDELTAASKVLDEAGIFSSSLPGEAAQDQVIGRLTANITAGQKRDLAGLALDIAESRGMTLSQLALEHPDDVDDALRVVVQYPRHGFLASPLARTMNLVFFPMRYNLKVTKLAAEALSRQPPVHPESRSALYVPDEKLA